MSGVFKSPTITVLLLISLGVFLNHQLHRLLLLFSHSVVSNSLWPHVPQHAWLPCPSPTPGVYSNSYWLSWWCHPTISSSVIPFLSRLQSFPELGSFPMTQLFASGGQSIGCPWFTILRPGGPWLRGRSIKFILPWGTIWVCTLMMISMIVILVH